MRTPSKAMREVSKSNVRDGQRHQRTRAAAATSPSACDQERARSRCGRRQLVVGALAALATTWAARPAWAGTYLTSTALLVRQARGESDTLRKRLHDKELARLVHQLAKARLKVAAGMHVPPEVAQAHPHLMLVLEHHERAAEAATQREYERFLILSARAREEEETFRAILKQLGWELPSESR